MFISGWSNGRVSNVQFPFCSLVARNDYNGERISTEKKKKRTMKKKKKHFDILASGKTDYHCKVEETLFIIQE